MPTVFKNPMQQADAIEQSELHEPYKTRIPKGSSLEHKTKIDAEYENYLPYLKEQGYKTEGATWRDTEKYLDDLFATVKADEELQGLYRKGRYNEGNALYNDRYGKKFQALMTMTDKLYNDEWWEKAPMGWEDE